MKNKDRFDSYDAAWYEYYGDVGHEYDGGVKAYEGVILEYGATRMEWGFGRWLWLDYNPDKMAYWRSMRDLGILTADGRKRLARADGDERRDSRADSAPTNTQTPTKENNQ